MALASARGAADTPSLFMSSDLVVEKTERVRRAVVSALTGALEDRINTFGSVPTRPEIVYGYIVIGGRLSVGVHTTDGFVEKPNLMKAEAFLAEGGYLWNAGIFLFRAGDYLADRKSVV